MNGVNGMNDGYCKVRFRRSKPCSQGISRVISLTINTDIASRDFEGPNPFFKAFLGLSLTIKTDIARWDFEGPNFFPWGITRVISLTIKANSDWGWWGWWGDWGDWGDWGECKLRFWRSKPFSQGIPRAISLTIKANIARWDLKVQILFSRHY